MKPPSVYRFAWTKSSLQAPTSALDLITLEYLESLLGTRSPGQSSVSAQQYNEHSLRHIQLDMLSLLVGRGAVLR